MATLYKKTYTYTGQNSWTTSDRIVYLKDFTVSGDSAEIKQIVSIQFDHRHRSSSSKTYNLQACLELDGTLFFSNVVTKSMTSNTICTIRNSFNDDSGGCPSASIWNYYVNDASSHIVTLTEEDEYYSYVSDGVLQWYAGSNVNKMQIVVYYYDTYTPYYNPVVEKFDAYRTGSVGGVADDEGVYASFVLKLNYVVSYPTMYVSVYYGTSIDSQDTLVHSLSFSPSSAVFSSEQVYSISSSYVFSTGVNYYFRLVFTVGDEIVDQIDLLPRSFASLHISDCSTGGVAVGCFSSSTEGNPKFEVAHPAYFYGGIAQIGNGSDPSTLLNGMGIQYGSTSSMTFSSDDTTASISFPKEFASTPLVIVSPVFTSYSATSRIMFAVVAQSTTGATIHIYDPASATSSIPTGYFNWIAIGTIA